MDKSLEMSMLYDLYSVLLTQKQRDIFSMYYEENYSLAEIANMQGISKVAVHDSLKHSEKRLHSYEEMLQLMQKHMELGLIVKKTAIKVDDMINSNVDNRKLIEDLTNLKSELFAISSR